MPTRPIAFCILSSTLTFASAQSVPSDLLDLYKDLHTHPELSHHEERTSSIVAEALRKDGYSVTDHIGIYPDGSHAFGVVGILKNGSGPTLLIRADMDALPIVEETGLPYASHVRTKNPAGQDVGVMHACGHDVHTTVLLGVARNLVAQKDKWHGTVMLLAQPSEETIDGAKAMLADHLYDRLGKPDMIIGLHDSNELAAGMMGVTPGPAMASSTSIDVTIQGIGGHGSAPQLGRDPITLAALYITQIQTIVSREEDPQDPTVVTVGDIHGGTKRNIIPDDVKLELTVRTFSDKARQTVIDGLTNMAAGLTTAAALPPAKAATVKVLENESTPVLFNDPDLMARVRTALVATLGKDNVATSPRHMGSEDVGVFGLKPGEGSPGAGSIPVAYFWLGAMDPAKLAAAKAQGKLPPGPHTSKFEPLPEPTLTTGINGMTAVAESLLK
jgi:hippurate hydrolase